VGAINVISRLLAATFGGYLLANLAALAFTYVLPGDRAAALQTGILLSFLVCAVAIIWAFAAQTALRVWAGLGLANGATAIVWLVAKAVAP